MSVDPRALLRNPLAETLAKGGLGLALIVQKMASVDIAVAAQACGFDALSVDLEHSVIPEAAAAQICIAAHHAGVTGLVRVPSHEAHIANRLLDAGAMGVIAPHVESAEEARAIVRACKFAPEGMRSVSYQWPQLGYRRFADARAVRAAFNATSTVVVMLESPEAVARADQIAAVPGVDIVHVGSVDLSDAMDLPGQIDHPQMIQCFERVIQACRAHGKVAGIGGVAGNPAAVQRVIGMGARFITAGIEWHFMLIEARRRVGALRSLQL